MQARTTEEAFLTDGESSTEEVVVFFGGRVQRPPIRSDEAVEETPDFQFAQVVTSLHTTPAFCSGPQDVLNCFIAGAA